LAGGDEIAPLRPLSYLASVSAELIAALLALAASLIVRRRRRRAQLGLDDLVLALSLHAGLVALAATVLAWAGWLGVHSLALSCAVLALLSWPWGIEREQAPTIERPRALGPTLVVLAILAGGVALRTPSIPAALAGRDQGTYVLRAQLSMRTGTLGWTDSVLARAGEELEGGAPPAGALDLLGLYPSGDEAWRRGRYEAAYRPGAYLGDREAGEVVPQFFHLHPMLLAAGGLAVGVEKIGVVVTWVAGLWLACLACCARRLWPRGPWAALGLALVAASPLAIWTGRTPLSENPMALFEWSAVLVALRMRAGCEAREPIERPATGAWLVAGFLGLCAGVRGNALVILPLVLALAWLRPRGPGERAPYLVLASLLASVIVHSLTSYPYLHDELLRQLPELGLGPAALATIAVFGAAAWVVVDRELAASEPAASRARLLAALPRVLALLTLGAVVWWWSQRSAAPPGRPYSRLDAAPILLGLPLLAAAGAGTIVVARRWRPGPEQVWLVALAAVIPATALLYASRQLPQLSFFYYGRYLVPELLPAAALAATAAVEAGVRWLAGGERARLRGGSARAKAAVGLGLAAALGLLGSVAGPLLRHPQLRLREHVAAGEAVAWLAARLPEGAIVIAGGEGWHNAHTHNQVGGALAMAHGIEVLPYRTREDAWVSAWELLVAGPARRGEAPPPVYLLVNEAAHPYTRADGAKVALLDEQLWAPFVVERLGLLELFVHALTPLPEQLPTRVARHELRMALLRLQVDPKAMAHVEVVEFGAGEAPPGVEVHGGLAGDGSTCVSPDRPLTLTLPRSVWATHLVVVTELAGEGMSRRVPRWSLSVDGVPVPFDPPPGLRPRYRATIGPVPLPIVRRDEAPGELKIEIRGASVADDARGHASCPYGRVAKLLLLPRERSTVFELEPEHVEAVTIAPEETLGHRIEPSTWVTGRSLSRYRPGTTPTPEIAGLAMVLPAGMSLSFAPVDLPLGRLGRPRPFDVVLTLARTRTPEDAQLRVYADDRLIGTLEPPPMREGSWVAKPFVWRPFHDRAQLRVELHSPGGGAVELRELALFARQDGLGPAPVSSAED
jgi:hypothetical protein